jgi:hypothetical protein
MRFLINSSKGDLVWAIENEPVATHRPLLDTNGKQPLIISRASPKFSRILCWPDRGVNRCSPN